MIADKIKNARTIKKFAQEQVAEDLNVSRQTISIEGRMEASYPSSTALLVLSVMPTLIFELKRQMKKGILLALLPLYSRRMDNSVIAVNLWGFKPANGWICIICWLLIVAFVLLGIVKIVLNHMYIDNGKNAITISSVLISMIAVLYFSMIRETYCVVIVFLQLMIKGRVLFYAIGKVGIKVSIQHRPNHLLMRS